MINDILAIMSMPGFWILLLVYAVFQAIVAATVKHFWK